MSKQVIIQKETFVRRQVLEFRRKVWFIKGEPVTIRNLPTQQIINSIKFLQSGKSKIPFIAGSATIADLKNELTYRNTIVDAIISRNPELNKFFKECEKRDCKFSEKQPLTTKNIQSFQG